MALDMVQQAGICEYGNEPSVPMQCKQFRDYLIKY